jgi:acetyl-CoA synthetase
MRSYEETCATFRLDIPDTYNFGFDTIDRRAAERDKLAYIAVDASGEEVSRHDFSDLSRASNRVANALLDLGAGKGDFAFVMIPRIPAWYDTMVGCCKAGIVTMPCTNLGMPKDLEYRINESGAKLAIVTMDGAEKIDQVRHNCPSLETLIVIGGARDGWIRFEDLVSEVADGSVEDRVEPTKSSDLMLIYFTSGTTGMPKMVPRNHGYALAHAITGRFWMDLREDDMHWALSDTGWAKAAWGMLYAPWQMGAAMVLFDGVGMDADLHLRLLEKFGVTTFCAPPTAYRMFAQMDLGEYDLSSLRHSFAAGEPLNPEAIKSWKEASGTLIHDGYGQTETVNLVANFPCLPVRPGSMGKPVPGLDVDVLDDGGNRVPDHEIGQIAVRVTEPYPPGLFDGYMNAPEINGQVFRHGWYYTGDTATRDEDGYFWFVGRSDDIITSAGYRISPFEVESVLLEHAAVAEPAVIGIPDALRGEIVKAFIVLAEGYEPSETLAAELQDYVKQQTAPYKYPREVAFVDSLPKTISGKIRRVELRRG